MPNVITAKDLLIIFIILCVLMSPLEHYTQLKSKEEVQKLENNLEEIKNNF
jgi:hypothetical protein